MAKRWRKQKAEQQTKKRRKLMHGSGDAGSAAGTLGGLRRFTKGLFGGGRGNGRSKSAVSRAVDVVLWAAVAVAAYFLIARQCMR